MNGELVAEFTVYGTAKPAGSKRAFAHPKTGQIIVTDQSGAAGKTWRTDVKNAALEVMDEPLRGAVGADITFFRQRPKGHYGSGKNAALIKGASPAYPITMPDVDKLSRAVLDALTGIAWVDDAQVTDKVVRKRYAETARAEIKVYRINEQLVSDLPVDQQVRAASDPLPQNADQGSLLPDTE